MNISFIISSKANTINFQDIKDASLLEHIKLITQDSSLLFDGLGESSSKEDKGHVLKIYLSSTDESYKPYSNFEYLFQYNTYQEWRKVITATFPELAAKFPLAEKEAKNRQELYRITEEVENYKDDRNSFHTKEQYIDALRKRITELQHELFPISSPRFNFLT